MKYRKLTNKQAPNIMVLLVLILKLILYIDFNDAIIIASLKTVIFNENIFIVKYD